jgi:hypothetical protein
MMRVMKGRIEALAGSLNAQGVANTRGRMVLEGRAGTFNAQDVANTLWGDAGAGGPGGGAFNSQDLAHKLWAACLLSTFRSLEEQNRSVLTWCAWRARLRA